MIRIFVKANCAETRQAMCVYRYSERNLTIIDVEKKYVLHRLSVFLNRKLSSTQNACAILTLLSVVCGALPYFNKLPPKWRDFREKKILNIKLIKNIKRVF